MITAHLVFFFKQFNPSSSSGVSGAVTVGRVTGFENQVQYITVVV